MFNFKPFRTSGSVVISLLTMSFGVNQIHSMEQPEEQNNNKLSIEIRTNYYKLVKAQIAREESEKESLPHDWGRESYTLGNETKKNLNLDPNSAQKNGLTFFYKQFLTTDQTNFADKLVYVARMQGACSDPGKAYGAAFFISKQNGTSYENGNILVKQYAPASGEPFDVTLYGFFVESLKSIPNLQALTSDENNQIKMNLKYFNYKIGIFLKYPPK